MIYVPIQSAYCCVNAATRRLARCISGSRVSFSLPPKSTDNWVLMLTPSITARVQINILCVTGCTFLWFSCLAARVCALQLHLTPDEMSAPSEHIQLSGSSATGGSAAQASPAPASETPPLVHAIAFVGHMVSLPLFLAMPSFSELVATG